jgi:hypothetical protein
MGRKLLSPNLHSTNGEFGSTKVCRRAGGKKLMAIDRSANAWPKEFSYELDEALDGTLSSVIVEAQSETRVHIRSISGEREYEPGFDRQTAA